MKKWPLVLMYHRVVLTQNTRDLSGNSITADDFDQQLDWLLRHDYTCAPLAAVATALHERQPLDALPERSFAITFDDGYSDNYVLAWPILRRYGFTATIFLVTDCIGGSNEFDHARGLNAVRMLTRSQIREMHVAGIDFGSHTCSHPADLTSLQGPSLEHELLDSRLELESLLDAQCLDFSYPHGKMNAAVEDAVERAGYALACGAVGTRFAPYCLSRVDAAKWAGTRLPIGILERDVRRLVRRRIPEVQQRRSSVSAA